MKKNFLFLSAIMIASALFLNSCTKDDVTIPTITLKGVASSEIELGATWTDAGVTADDDTDGDITSKVETLGTVNVDQCGTYVIKYNVTDEAGNVAEEVTREVKVKSTGLIGTYNCSDVVTGAGAGTYNYTLAVTQSSTTFNKILIGNFGGYGTAVSISAIVNGSTFTIASQPNTGCTAGSEASITGSGTYVKEGTNFKITSMTYTANYTAGGADNGTVTCTKQ